MKTNQTERTDKIAKWLKNRIKGMKPTIAVIMGSGLSESVPDLKNTVKIPYGKIPDFLKSSVKGHAGQLLFGKYADKTIAVMQGRFHYYEGHDINDLAIPIRTFWKLGVKNLIVTAAAGSVRKEVKPGDMVILKDHINFMGCSPLRGIYDKSFGQMFTDMTQAYDKKLRKLALKICRKHKIRASEGIYLAGFGPSYETPAEIKAFKMWGADVVGMSTVPEVITARQLDMRILAMSWVTNLASGVSKSPLNHKEVLEQGKKVVKQFKSILKDILKSSELGE